MDRNVLLICVSGLLISCNNPQGLGDLPRFIETAGQDMAPKVDPLPPLQPVKNFAYTATDLVDPFNVGNVIPEKQQQDVGLDKKGPDNARLKEPLESYPLSSLKIVGMMQRGQMKWGIIRTPDDRVYRVTKGNYVGKDYGRINRLDSHSIEFVEMVNELNGRWKERTVRLMMEGD